MLKDGSKPPSAAKAVLIHWLIAARLKPCPFKARVRLRDSAGLQRAFEELAVFHDYGQGFAVAGEHGDVFQRVAVYEEEVGGGAFADRAKAACSRPSVRR